MYAAEKKCTRIVRGMSRFFCGFEVMRFCVRRSIWLSFFGRSLADLCCSGGAMAEAMVAAEAAEAPQRVCACCGKVVPEAQLWEVDFSESIAMPTWQSNDGTSTM